jgi:hypothetical protein
VHGVFGWGSNRTRSNETRSGSRLLPLLVLLPLVMLLVMLLVGLAECCFHSLLPV